MSETIIRRSPSRPAVRRSRARQRSTVDLLLADVAAGDRAAFEALYRMLSPHVLRTVDRLLPEGEDGLPVLWGTFVEVWLLARRHLEPTDGDPCTAGLAWIDAVTRRRAGERALVLAAGPGPVDTDLTEAARESLHIELIVLLTPRPGEVTRPAGTR